MIDPKRPVTAEPTQDECEAIKRAYDKILEAGITFDIEACVQMGKIFSYYGVKTDC